MQVRWEELEAFVNPLSNYQEYRLVLTKTHAPYIPYLGAITKDLTGMLEAPTFSSKGTHPFINWRKIMILGRILLGFGNGRAERYSFFVPPAYLDVLEHLEVYEESRLYEMSRQCEPTDAQRKQEKQEKQESKERLKEKKQPRKAIVERVTGKISPRTAGDGTTASLAGLEAQLVHLQNTLAVFTEEVAKVLLCKYRNCLYLSFCLILVR